MLASQCASVPVCQRLSVSVCQCVSVPVCQCVSVSVVDQSLVMSTGSVLVSSGGLLEYTGATQDRADCKKTGASKVNWRSTLVQQ